MKMDVIINRDALYALRELPSESVNCCVTSPPYYGLRDYGLDAQIGREDTPEQYIGRLVEVFRELRRVLKDDGTFWLNIADTYCGSGMKAGCKQKDLIGIPWLLAFALRSDGWYLRSDIIWLKENPMPESCRERLRGTDRDAAQDTNTPRKYRDRARCRVSISPAAAAIMTTLLYRPQGTSGTFGLSIPYRIRAGILPPIPRSSRKRAYWRAVRQAALSLTRFLEAAPPGLQRKALTAAISALN